MLFLSQFFFPRTLHFNNRAVCPSAHAAERQTPRSIAASVVVVVVANAVFSF